MFSCSSSSSLSITAVIGRLRGRSGGFLVVDYALACFVILSTSKFCAKHKFALNATLLPFTRFFVHLAAPAVILPVSVKC